MPRENQGDEDPFRDYIAVSGPEPEGVKLRDYFEAILEEQRRGIVVAEQEREKAASALRAELTRQIEQGDQSLRDHINAQIEQIKLLSHSLDEQARLRIDAVAHRLEELNEAGHAHVESRILAVEQAAELHVSQLRREREMVTSAQQEAIAKAEMANEKRFEAANEWRGQSADRERSQQEEMRKLMSTFIPREVADAQIAELRTQITDLGKRQQELAERITKLL